MKKLILTSAILFSLLLTSFSYAQWTQIGPNCGSGYWALPLITDMCVSGDTIFASNNYFGIHYTTDFGITWCETNKIDGELKSIAKDGSILLAGSFGVLRSSDNGSNFSTYLAPYNVLDVDVKNNWAIEGNSDNNGVYCSTNSGATWYNGYAGGTWSAVATDGSAFYIGNFLGVQKTTSPGVVFTGCLSSRYVTAIKIIGSSIYACSTTGLDVSTNQGATWSQLNITGDITSVGVCGTDLIVARGNNILKSTNNGVNWNIVYTSATSITSLATSDNYIVAVDNSTVYRSSNNGVSWSQHKFHFMQAYTIFKTPTALYSSTNYLGVFRSTDNGGNWSHITETSQFTSIRSFASSGSLLFCGLNSKGVYVSTNDGLNWSQSGINGATIFSLFNTTGSVLLAGSQSNGIYYTTNNGANWVQTNIGSGAIYSIHENNGKLFAGGSAAGFYISTNGGTIWNQQAITPSALSSFASINNYVFAGGGAGVYVSSNNGANWTATSFTGYTLSLVSSGNLLFAGTESTGIFLSTDYGTTWKNVNRNLGPKLSVSRMMISGNDLYAAAYTTSVLKAPISNLVDVSNWIDPAIPDKFALHQNYPNPFNPTTKISYEIQKAGNVTLKIYDVLGNEIAELVNEKKNAGSYSVTFDAGKYNLSSGIYFYKLTANNFEDTKRMVLVK